MTALKTAERRTDLRATEPHYGYREVFSALHCFDPDVIEPVDSVSSDPLDATIRQAIKQHQGASS